MKRIIGLVLVLALLSCSAFAEDKKPAELLREYAELLVGEWIDCDNMESVVIDKNDLYISANGTVYWNDYSEIKRAKEYEILFSIDFGRIAIKDASERKDQYTQLALPRILVRPNDNLKSFSDDPESFITSGKWIYIDNEDKTTFTMVFDSEKVTLSNGTESEVYDWDLHANRNGIRFSYYGDGWNCDILFVNGVPQIEWDDGVYFTLEK